MLINNTFSEILFQLLFLHSNDYKDQAFELRQRKIIGTNARSFGGTSCFENSLHLNLLCI